MLAHNYRLSELFEGMKWHQLVELILAAGVMVAIPISYHITIWLFYVLMGYGIIRHIVMLRRESSGKSVIEGPAIWKQFDFWGKLALGLTAGFWGLYVLSMIWSENISEGTQRIIVMLPLLLGSVYIATAGSRFLTTKRIRALGNIFICAIVVLFAVKLCIALEKLIFEGCELKDVWSTRFHKQPYTYMSMYLAAGLCYVFMEWLKGGYAQRRWWMIVAMVVMWMWTIIANSRAGMLTMYVLTLAMGVVLGLETSRATTALKGWMKGIVFVSVVWGASLGINASLPDNLQRLTNTIENEVKIANEKKSVTEEKDTTEKPKEDARKSLFKCGWAVVQRGPWYGYGVGDAENALVVEFEDYGYTSGVKERQNAHDQYMDALLTGGWFYLIVLVLIMGMVAITCMKNGVTAGWLYMGVMALNLCFESMLYREVGMIPFMVFTGGLLVLCRRDMKEPEIPFSGLTAVEEKSIGIGS